jgi:hypothetical protein
MWSKSSIATLAIASLALIGSATTPDNCPSDLACCTTADFRRSIFPRTVCPASQKQCCQRNGKVTHVSPLSDTLQCGKSTEAVAPLSIEIAACPSDITKQCLHFNYGSNTDGINYVDVHLGIYTTALSSFVPPGQLNAKNYCSLTNGGATAGCWIPLTDLSNIYLGGADVCTSSLYVVAHVSYPDSGSINGNTCYGQGSDVGGSNWAMQFQITLSCTQECIKQCCCPSQVPDVWCPVGTAYGYNSEIAIAENTLSSTTCKHWVCIPPYCYRFPLPLSWLFRSFSHLSLPLPYSLLTITNRAGTLEPPCHLSLAPSTSAPAITISRKLQTSELSRSRSLVCNTLSPLLTKLQRPMFMRNAWHLLTAHPVNSGTRLILLALPISG